MTTSYMLGVPCRLIALPLALEQWIRRHWDDMRPVEPAEDYRIDVAHLPWAPRTPAQRVAAPQTTTLDGVSIDWLRHAERAWSTGDAEEGVSLRLFDRRARIRVWTSESSVGPTTLLALHVALCEALRARGFVALHAAVAVRDGQATALLGPSGVGKTTTLLRAIDDGWFPLAEDFVWFEPATGRVHAWRGERGVHLEPTSLSELPAPARSRASRHGADGKLEVAYDAVARQRPVSAELTRFVLLMRDASRISTMQPLAPRDAARALWESAGVPLCRVNREAFAARVPALVAGLDWQHWTLGSGRLVL